MKIPGKQDKGTSPLLFGFYQKDSTLILISETGELKHYLDRMRNDSMKGCTLNQFLLNFFELLIAEDVLDGAQRPLPVPLRGEDVPAFQGLFDLPQAAAQEE